MCADTARSWGQTGHCHRQALATQGNYSLVGEGRLVPLSGRLGSSVTSLRVKQSREGCRASFGGQQGLGDDRGLPKVNSWTCRAGTLAPGLPRDRRPLDHGHGLLSYPEG